MSLIPHATLPFLVHQTPQINRVSRSSTVSPAVSRNAADCPPFASFLCTFPSATLTKPARQASYFSEPSSPSSRLLYFIQIFLLPVLRCVVLQPCLAYLLSSSLSSLSYTRPTITVIFEPSALCKRGRTVHGSLPLPEPSVLDFSLIAVPANTLAHANTFGVPA